VRVSPYRSWAHYAPYERGRGLANASLYYFHKPLSNIDEQDIATLAAVVQSPSRYKPGTTITNLRTDTRKSKAFVGRRDTADPLKWDGPLKSY